MSTFLFSAFSLDCRFAKSEMSTSFTLLGYTASLGRICKAASTKGLRSYSKRSTAVPKFQHQTRFSPDILAAVPYHHLNHLHPGLHPLLIQKTAHKLKRKADREAAAVLTVLLIGRSSRLITRSSLQASCIKARCWRPLHLDHALFQRVLMK